MSTFTVRPALDDPVSASSSNVRILLSTYNGAAYLREQLDSIVAQTHGAWTVIARDDGSSDDTLRILETYARADARIRLLRDARGNVGTHRSFALLLQHAEVREGGYVCLCDQDDVWLPDKLGQQLNAIRAIERTAGSDRPVLVYSDARVVDSSLAPVHGSFHAYQGASVDPRHPLRALLVHNGVVLGCCSIVNGALLELAVPLPDGVVHDWWLAQCAAACGELAYLPAATVRYRQHGENVAGARPRRQRLRVLARNPAAYWTASGPEFALALRQAAHLAQRIRSRPDAACAEAAREADGFVRGFNPDLRFGERLRAIAGTRAAPSRRLGKLLFYLLFLLYPRLAKRA